MVQQIYTTFNQPYAAFNDLMEDDAVSTAMPMVRQTRDVMRSLTDDDNGKPSLPPELIKRYSLGLGALAAANLGREITFARWNLVDMLMQEKDFLHSYRGGQFADAFMKLREDYLTANRESPMWKGVSDQMKNVELSNKLGDILKEGGVSKAEAIGQYRPMRWMNMIALGAAPMALGAAGWCKAVCKEREQAQHQQQELNHPALGR